MPDSSFTEATLNFSFLVITPLKKPRTECGCQPVALISSLSAAPPGRFSNARIFSALVPPRAGGVARAAEPALADARFVAAFLAGRALAGEERFGGVTGAPCWARRAFPVASGAAFSVACFISIDSGFIVFLLAAAEPRS